MVIWLAATLIVGLLIQPLVGAALGAVGAWRLWSTARNKAVILLSLAVLLLLFAVFFSVPFGLGREGDFSESGSTPQ